MESQKPHPQRPVPSKAELLSSAKLLADAARGGKEKVDKPKVAGAAADLFGAAAHYGKLEEKGMGKYVGKAEDYLRQYNSSHSSSAAAGGEAHQPPQHSGAGGSGGGGGGYGDYAKLAEGLLKKQSGGGSAPAHHSGGGGGSGFGDYVKLAEGFMKKR